jgi:hypothetical protein
VAAIAATVGTTAAAPLAVPLRGLGRPLLGLFTDLGRLARALATRRGGRFERVPAARTSEAVGSLAPGTIVVRIEDDEALVHRL